MPAAPFEIQTDRTAGGWRVRGLAQKIEGKTTFGERRDGAEAGRLPGKLEDGRKLDRAGRERDLLGCGRVRIGHWYQMAWNQSRLSEQTPEN